MFSYAFQEQAGQYVIESREFEKIKQRLLFSLTNFGKPWIYVVDGNYRNRGELLLQHEHNGRRPEAGPGGGHAGQHPVHLEPAGPPADGRRRQADHACPSTAPTTRSEPEEKPMTLDETLRQKLADWRPDTPGQALTVADGEAGWTAVVVADTVDTLGGRLQELRLARTTPLETTASLDEQARHRRPRHRPARAAAPGRGGRRPRVAQLRSEVPARQGNDRHYYEVMRHASGDTTVARLPGPGRRRGSRCRTR